MAAVTFIMEVTKFCTILYGSLDNKSVSEFRHLYMYVEIKTSNKIATYETYFERKSQ